MRVDISGDMAYVVSEGVFPSYVIKDDHGNLLDEKVPVIFEYRSIEVYKRDDGAGSPEWKTWHFHCSSRPPNDAVPPAKTRDDAADRRGLGNTPHSRAVTTDFSEFFGKGSALRQA